MRRENFRRLGVVLSLWLMALTLQAQYTVTGGKGAPLLVNDDTSNRLQIYMVYGASDVQISYSSTSASTPHQWYRYKKKALEAEKVPSVQNGTSSTLVNPEEGYGYFVEEPNLTARRYMWLIDYSKYAFDIQSLQVAEGSDPCSGLRLDGAAHMPQMTYYTPTGQITNVKRECEANYLTLEWSEDNKSFSQIQETTVETLTRINDGNAFYISLPAPLCDTDITLKGDLFARHFGVEKSKSIDEYQAIAVEVHADTTLVVDFEPDNMASGNEGLSAPATMRFTAYANEPVAAVYMWKIYKKGDEKNPLIEFTGDEVEYTFRDAGDYEATVEVGDRTSQCTGMPENAPFTLKISVSALDVPNVFSPGTTPGINDEFKVAYKSLVRFKGWIFNRWGAEMFHWTNPAQGWDGKKGGKYVSPGVYFYIIEAEGSDGIKYKKKGDINILRPKTIEDEIIEE